MKKYLLSTGKTTTQTEKYIEDLFRIYFVVYPDDIPGASNIGFDYIMTDVKKDEVKNVLRSRIEKLIELIKSKFKTALDIRIHSLDLLTEEKARLILDINQVVSDEITLDLYES